MTFRLEDVRVLHLEPTTKCNAACPQCSRTSSHLYNDAHNRSELTLAFLQEVLPERFVAQLDKMFMCGTFGDPAAATETLGIFNWFREVNPNITLGINSNGGVRSADWWGRLGQILNRERDFAVFSIDGLEDTNHIYRVNVRWDKVMKNASSFISAGGNAHWDMLVYEHNAHQVADAINSARTMGFKRFRSKVTKRMTSRPVQWLALPTGYAAPLPPLVTSIQCHALKEQSIYLAANGMCLPCCFVGDKVFTEGSDLDNLIGLDNIRLGGNGLNDIIERFAVFVDSWQGVPFGSCAKTCGVDDISTTTMFDQQWRNEVIL